MSENKTLQKVHESLHAAGYKLTPQREHTVMVLIENQKNHLSAEEIYMLVKEKAPEIGLATVYRTLEVLTELKIINKISFNDGLARYDLRKEGSKHAHHHLLCLECGGIEEVEEDLLANVEEVVAANYHFVVRDHRLTFHGICSNCQKLEANE